MNGHFHRKLILRATIGVLSLLFLPSYVFSIQVSQGPSATSPIRLIPCSVLTMAASEVPYSTYVIVRIAENSTLPINSTVDPVVDVKIAPPTTLVPTNLYSCPRDYTAWIVNGNARLRFNRKGLYWVRVTLQSGLNLEGYVAVDIKTLCGDNGNGGGPSEVDCGTPDVKAVSDELDDPEFGDPWAGDGDGGGEFVDGHESVGDAVDMAHRANGGEPVSLNISGHGGPGGVKIGDDPTRGSNDGGGAQDLVDAIKGKVSSVTIFACSTASGENGESLICELEEALGVEVTGYTGVVSYDDDGNWTTTGEAYSWEEKEEEEADEVQEENGFAPNVPSQRKPRLRTEPSIPLVWLSDAPLDLLLGQFYDQIGETQSPWDVNDDGSVDLLDIDILIQLIN